MEAAQQCSADLGETFASTACIYAVQQPGNKQLVIALGDHACVRARMDATTPDLATSACEMARAKAERAAWLRIETAAEKGTQPNLDIDQLVPGLPKSAAGASSSDNAAKPAGEKSALPIPPATTEYLDARFSFRDVPFESPPNRDMRLVEDRGDAKVYVRDIESMAIGDGKLSSVAYQFWKYKLARVMLKTDGASNNQAMLQVFQTTYGPGYKPTPSSSKRLWQGHRASALYEEDQKSDSATASIWSNELKQEEERESAKAQH